jgi:hypothetical protein
MGNDIIKDGIANLIYPKARMYRIDVPKLLHFRNEIKDILGRVSK